MRQEEQPLVVVVTWWDRKTFKHLYIMIQTKQLYEAPEAQTLVVRFEGVICQSTGEQLSEQENWSGKGGWV